MRILSFCLLISLSLNSWAEIPEIVEELNSNFKKTVIQCPETLWHDYTWDNHQVVYVYSQSENSYIWDVDTDTTSEVMTSSIANEMKAGIFSFAQSDDKFQMSLNLGLSPDLNKHMFRIGVHEFFHFTGQKGWEDTSTGRGTAYPLDYEPRILLKMTYRNMVKYFLEEDPRYLGQASYWFKRWQSEYAAEVLATTDGYEGTARYFESLADATRVLGCGTSDEGYLSYYRPKLQNELVVNSDNISFQLDGEGYQLGGLAGLILRLFPGISLEEFSEQAAKGYTTIEILLGAIDPIEEEVDALLEQAYVTKADELNQGWGQYLDPTIESWDNLDSVRVVIPVQLSQGSFSPRFFAISTQIDKELFPFATEQSFLSLSSDFVLKENTVVITDENSPCPFYGWTTLQSAEDLPDLPTIDSVAFELDNAQIQGQLKGSVVQDSEGYSYICVE